MDDDHLFDGWQDDDGATPESRALYAIPPERCEQCQRRSNALIQVGTAAYPEWLCGTCLHRKQRRANTYEMWGHGRRGY